MGSCTKCGAKKGTKSSAGVSLSRIVGCGGRDRAGRARAGDCLDYHSAGGSALHFIHMVTRALFKIETSNLGTFSSVAQDELD